MKKLYEAVPVEEEKEFDLPPFAKVVVAFRKQEWKGLEPGYIQHIRATKDEVLARRQMIETKIEFWLREVEVGSSVSTDAHTREVAEKAVDEALDVIFKDCIITDIATDCVEQSGKQFLKDKILARLNPEGK